MDYINSIKRLNRTATYINNKFKCELNLNEMENDDMMDFINQIKNTKEFIDKIDIEVSGFLKPSLLETLKGSGIEFSTVWGPSDCFYISKKLEHIIPNKFEIGYIDCDTNEFKTTNSLGDINQNEGEIWMFKFCCSIDDTADHVRFLKSDYIELEKKIFHFIIENNCVGKYKIDVSNFDLSMFLNNSEKILRNCNIQKIKI